jgi:acetyl esterase/lipase
VANPPFVDAECAQGLQAIPPFEFSAETLPIMRQMAVFGPPELGPDLERHEVLAGPEQQVMLTLYRPSGAVADLPCLFWIHGGGMVMGDRHLNDAALIEWCRDFSCACVTVEYRLAPEHPYPAALDDCHTGLMHVLTEADSLGIDATRVGVGGQSAGGGLAAALALRIRDEGRHELLFQYLEYPMLDDRQATPSSLRDELAMWSRESNAYGWRSYLAELYGTDQVPVYAAPGRADDLSGLPASYVCVGTADGFRDEAIDYARRLTSQGVVTELHVYAGAPHAFQMFSQSEVGRCGVRDSESWLRRQLAPGSAGSSGAPAAMLNLP